jgi:integrase/recombinase XerD
MKKELLAEGFKNWLKTLNYLSSAKTAPKYAAEFLNWLETNKITELSAINRTIVKRYFDYLQTRKNKRFGGVLSLNNVRAHLTSLKQFARYLQQTQNETLEITITLPVSKTEKQILSKAEIEILYKTTTDSILGYRDRAMLAVYYGCGLRRSEGLALDVKDILFERKVIHVRKGKNYRERFTPMSEGVTMHLHKYIHHARTYMVAERSRSMTGEKKETALFVNGNGKRLTGNGIITRLQNLAKVAEINKTIGLHTLRHSIATHLLQSGMKLEFVSQFLGHSTLESTQIYTHIASLGV